MKKIKEYKGNSEEFKVLNEQLDQPFNADILYYDEEKKNKKYIGKIINNEYEGRGILYEKSGEVKYNGYFKKGEFEGYGRIYKEGELIYEGYFIKSEYSGKGILYNDNAKKKYDGYFINGKFDGVGIIYQSTRKIKMTFRQGKPIDESFSILYDKNDNVIFEGLIYEKNPENAKNVAIYSYPNYSLYIHIKYIGDLNKSKYDGKGILYYNSSESIYFKGIFNNGDFKNGVSYDPKGKEIYIGDFINNKPKEGKDIEVYNLYKNLEYKGDLVNGTKEGYGTIYYENGKTLYSGMFKNGKIYGKGVKYYKNGTRKIEGIFKSFDTCEGKYYNPENKELYEGLIIKEIPVKSDHIILYDDNLNKIYEGKIYHCIFEEMDDCIFYGEKNENSQNLEKLESAKKEEDNFGVKVMLVSYRGVPGKTCLFRRLTEDVFYERSIATIGIDKKTLEFNHNNNNYSISLFDTSGGEKYFPLTLNYYKGTDIFLYLVDLYRFNEIPEQFFEDMKNVILKDRKNKLIYVVGNKFDLAKEKVEILLYRTHIKQLIKERSINILK